MGDYCSAVLKVRLEVARRLTAIDAGLDSLSPKEAIDELAALAADEPLKVGADEFSAIVAGGREFEAKATAAQGQAKADFRVFQEKAQENITSWKTKETVVLKEIDDRRKALEAQHIRLDMAYIQKLAKDEARYKQIVANLKTWMPHLGGLKRNRKAASKRRWAAREQIATIRDAYARDASETLKSALSDLIVSVKFVRSAYSPDAERQIIETMGWRTTQVPESDPISLDTELA